MNHKQKVLIEAEITLDEGKTASQVMGILRGMEHLIYKSYERDGFQSLDFINVRLVERFDHED